MNWERINDLMKRLYGLSVGLTLEDRVLIGSFGCILLNLSDIRVLIKQSKGSCLPDCLDPIRYTQFGKDMAHMAFDGIIGNDQFLRDLLVGCSLLK